MNISKSILLTTVYSMGLLIPAIALADTDPATFQADKDREIASVLEKVQIAQKHLSCVQAAQDHAGLKVCDETFNPSQNVPETKVKEQGTDKKDQKIENNKKK